VSPGGSYYYGDVVTVWANASVGSTFTGFSGDLSGLTTPQNLTMTSNKAVNAEFTLDGPFTLTLTTSGTGSGTIQVSPGGSYYYGDVVTVWANASVGSTFTGFSGDLSGLTTPQNLTMTSNKAVNAEFTLDGPFTLTLTTSGTGSGTIQVSPGGSYYYGDVVTVWANASVGSTFTGFSGDLSGLTTPQNLTMTSNKAVNAEFTLDGPFTLTLTTSGTGSGTIQVSPGGSYYYGDVVTVWANASVGSTFTGFSGDLSGLTTPQNLTMTSNKAVNAEFTLDGPFTLTLTTSGTGSGTIQVSPGGSYYYGDVVTVWANASVGSTFTGFSGDLSGLTTPQNLTMTSNKAVNAEFTLDGPFTLTLTTSGTGSGTIQVSPGGSYYYGDVVTVWANASVGSTFTGFSGDLSGLTTPQNLTMTSNKAVNAEFTLDGPFTLTLTTSGTGSGTIQVSPGGSYYYGDVVTVWANASVGSTFTGFSGDLSGLTTPQNLTMDGHKLVDAEFSLNGPYILTITIEPNNGGSVTTVPNPPYYYGDVVTLTAVENLGYRFSHWEGDLTGDENPKTITMNSNKTVIAHFNLTEEDTTPPLVKIIKPTNAIYIFNKEVIPFSMPIIIQSITLEVTASDNESGIDRVEFFVDGVLRNTDSSEPFSYDWREILSGKHTIHAKAYDKAGNNATTSEIQVFKWRFHPLLVLSLLIFAVIVRNRPQLSGETQEDDGTSRNQIGNHFSSFFHSFIHNG
jgi:hypothetical protein